MFGWGWLGDEVCSWCVDRCENRWVGRLARWLLDWLRKGRRTVSWRVLEGFKAELMQQKGLPWSRMLLQDTASRCNA